MPSLGPRGPGQSGPAHLPSSMLCHCLPHLLSQTHGPHFVPRMGQTLFCLEASPLAISSDGTLFLIFQVSTYTSPSQRGIPSAPNLKYTPCFLTLFSRTIPCSVLPGNIAGDDLFSLTSFFLSFWSVHETFSLLRTGHGINFYSFSQGFKARDAAWHRVNDTKHFMNVKVIIP